MTDEPTREEIDRTPGPVVLEFGAEWCEFCRATQPLLASLLQEFPAARHIRVEDGKGKPLGRSFQVKLWPTFVSCATARWSGRRFVRRRRSCARAWKRSERLNAPPIRRRTGLASAGEIG